MRRHAGGRRCGARGRGSLPRTREAPGPDRGALRPLRREPAGLGPFESFRNGPERDKALSRTGATAQIKEAERKPGNADPRDRNRRDGAPGGARVSGNGSAARRKTGAPLGAPSPRFSGGDKGRPASPGPQRIRAHWRAPMNPDDGAFTSLCCLTMES